MRTAWRLISAILLLPALLLPGAPAQAATLEHVPSFGPNPGSLAMFAHRPADVEPGRPLVVALHGCSQDAATYAREAGWSELADRWQFTVVLPQQSQANNSSRCFNWFEPGDIARGQGEAASIRSMVAHAVSTWGVNHRSVYVTGLSAGGAMTSALLSAYPDVFAGGSIVAGVPVGCATSMVEAFGCMVNPPSRTPEAWGDAVRAAAPPGTTTWPRVAIWHGTADHTVTPANAAASRDQWTNVHGTGQTPSTTKSLPGGTTQQTYAKGGRDVVATFTVNGMGHAVPVDPGTGTTQCGQVGQYAADTICSSYWTSLFWGLPGANQREPEPGPEPDPLECWTTSTYAHTDAERAYVRGGYAYAVGSDDLLGLWNVFNVVSLAETHPGHFELVSRCG